MATNGVSSKTSRDGITFQALRQDVEEEISGLSKTQVDFIGKVTQVKRDDFDTRTLVVQTIRDPFCARMYRKIPAPTIRRLNLAVAVLQCIFMAGPAFLYLAFPQGGDTNCVYVEPEQIPVSIYKTLSDKTSSGKITHLVFADGREHYDQLGGSRQTAHAAIAAHSSWNTTRGRGKEICSLVQGATLARREDTTRDYLGPLVDRTFDRDIEPVCGYWNGPDAYYRANDNEQSYWWDAFHQLKENGYHYGRYPQLQSERPVPFEQMDTITDSAHFQHVCVMKPIKVTVFGNENTLSILIGLLVTAFCGLYILGPANHSDTLFTLSYVGTVNIAGVVIMMSSYIVNLFAVWLLEIIFRYKFRKEIAAATKEDEDAKKKGGALDLVPASVAGAA